MKYLALVLFLFFGSYQLSSGQERYHIYAGNTHSHTIFTLSHGEQWLKKPGFKKYMYVDSLHVSETLNTTLRSDWRKYQGLPADHFSLAKKDGYDFYITTDHSQEASFYPVSPINAAWLVTGREAKDATDSNFVALRGYEHSENDGPDGFGHINVINSATYLSALQPGIDLEYLYKWLDTVSANGEGPVVASFNHPSAHQYNDWAYRDNTVTDIITMLEVINSNNHIHYEAFIHALDKGWKVSPVCGNDNHGLTGIGREKSRTFVLATSKTKVAILEAMKHRRTYASLDNNIQCRYSVNGEIMGSTIPFSKNLQFDINIKDPDTNNPNDKITKIDIVTDSGRVVKTYQPDPAYAIQWKPVIEVADHKFFFVRIWNAGGGDAKGADPAKPIAWLAPVWIKR